MAGHCYSVDFPPEFQNWKTTDPASLFSAPVIKKAEGKICKHLQSEAKGCDKVILWLDCDREGENICFEVLDNVLPHLNKKPGRKVYRAKFSALTESDVRRAMSNLVEPNENESKAVDARQELDLKIGVAWTRFQTQYFDAKYGNLDSRLISYGPCQTPTLGFCVARHDFIQSFTPEKFWYLALSVDVKGAGISLEWSKSRVFSKDVGVVFKKAVESEKVALVEEVKKKSAKKTRPQALNTVELLRKCSQLFGIGELGVFACESVRYVCLNRSVSSYAYRRISVYPRLYQLSKN